MDFLLVLIELFCKVLQLRHDERKQIENRRLADRLLMLISHLIRDGLWTNLTTGQRAWATDTTSTKCAEWRRMLAIFFTHVTTCQRHRHDTTCQRHRHDTTCQRHRHHLTGNIAYFQLNSQLLWSMMIFSNIRVSILPLLKVWPYGSIKMCILLRLLLILLYPHSMYSVKAHIYMHRKTYSQVFNTVVSGRTQAWLHCTTTGDLVSKSH